MATYSISSAKHQTLTANTADTVNLTYYGRYVQVIHRGSATNPIYVTAGKAPTAATVGGDNTFAVLSTVPLVIPWPVDSAGTTLQLSLISAGAESYSVQVLGDRLM